MAKENIKNVETAGFYYDAQLSNPLLTATLHTNTYIANLPKNSVSDPYETHEPFSWKLWKPTKEGEKELVSEGKVDCLEPITYHYSLAYSENPSACYRRKPLITAILTEDFMVQVGNSWGDAGGMTSIEQAFNQAKGMAAHSKEIGGGIELLSDSIKNLTSDPKTFIGKGVNWVNENILEKFKGDGKHTDRLNSALITQGSRFSYYGGTQTTFQNLTLRFTIFADWVYDEIRGRWVFKTVHEQLREIYPYAIGKYDPIDLGAGDFAASKSKNETLIKAAETADKVFSSFFGWQSPPGGFQSDIRSLDACQKGTLRLVLGGFYTAENLLIDGMSVNFSKTMTKIPPNVTRTIYSGGGYSYDGTYEYEEKIYNEKGEDTGNTKKIIKEKTFSGKEVLTERIDTVKESDLTPLYADVTINLRPATNYSDNAIIHFSSNKGLGKLNQEIVALRDDKLKKQVEKKREAESQEIIDYKKRLEAQEAYAKKEFYLKYETEEEIEDEILHVDKVEVEGNPNYKEDLSWGDEMINNLNNSVLSERTQTAKELGEYFQQFGNKANAGIGGSQPPIL